MNRNRNQTNNNISNNCNFYKPVTKLRTDITRAAVAQEEQLLKTDYEGELAAVKDYYVNTSESNR